VLSPALPQDSPPSTGQSWVALQSQAQAGEEEEEIQEAQRDQEESEHLPGGVGEASGSSESEDKSVAMDTENREEEGGNAAGSSWKKRKKSNDDLRIPGQLSSEAPPLDYHAKKKSCHCSYHNFDRQKLQREAQEQVHDMDCCWGMDPMRSISGKQTPSGLLQVWCH